MKRVVSLCASAALALAAATALALPGTFAISQIYSSADGAVQFIVVHDGGANDCDSHENLWAGQQLISTGAAPPRIFVFPANLPTCHTSDRDMLIATEAFAALGLVTPDFVIPNGFVQIPNGAVSFADVSFVSYTGLPADGLNAINRNGDPVPNRATNLAGVSASIESPPATPVTVVEYYNASLDHYFITWVPAEIAVLDAGTTIRGWVRTGKTFNAYSTAVAGTSPVCRFYIPPGYGDSHFFGRGQQECDETASKFPQFVNEDPHFMYLFLPVAGVCPAGTAEVHRAFSNRADANHRYFIDTSIGTTMVAQHWLLEGDGPDLVVMCAPA
jgi:hypothetical protein